MFAAASLKHALAAVQQLCPRHTFRGMFAAASLKLEQRIPYPERRADFPRHVCRGLIEAKTQMTHGVRSLSTFRGMFAAASLKRPARRFFPTPGTTFRGMFAAASLKRRIGRLKLLDLRTFRGMFAAASLKHPNNTATLTTPQGLSAACLPRPH